MEGQWFDGRPQDADSKSNPNRDTIVISIHDHNRDAAPPPGIGADDVFVYVDHWEQSFKLFPPEAHTLPVAHCEEVDLCSAVSL